jgi:mannose-6-phosphate isomerase
MVQGLEAPLRFEPQVLAKPWGGGGGLRAFGVNVPVSPPTGEVWLVSDVPGRPSVVSSGPHRGRTLEDLVRSEPAALLGKVRPPGGRFPLFVKFLEVKGRLSLQVHPDAQQASRNGDGLSGKFEAWSVLATEPAARVVIGFDRPSSPDEVRSLIASGQLEGQLNTFEPRAGDAYVISPGTVHAAWSGLVLFEVQETADVTYRLYDWGTVGLDGKPRELHVEKGLGVAKLGAASKGRPTPPAVVTRSPGSRVKTIVGPGAGPFVYEIVELERGATFAFGGDDRPSVAVTFTGALSLEDGPLQAGEAALFPAKHGRVVVEAPEETTFAIATPSA